MENKNNSRIIFMGTPDFAADILSVMLENKFNIISIYTREDKKVGRKQIIEQSPVKKIAEKNEIEIFQPKKFDENVASEIENQKPDLIVVCAYGKILPSEILKIPSYGVINTHPSSLPKYRGASPIQNALLQGEKEASATLMKMKEEIDAGDIIAQEKIVIGNEETYLELSKKLSEISAKLLVETIPLWMTGEVKLTKQDDAKATFCQMIKKEDGKIDWSEDAQKIYNRYRAFFVWPGVFTYWKKDNREVRIKLSRISLDKNLSENKVKTGEVFLENKKVKIKTGKENVILEEIQLEGKNKMSANDFVRGYANFVGSVLK